MKIVIDISERALEFVRRNGIKDIYGIEEAIINGTPLPKGHGRLIDADAMDYAEVDQFVCSKCGIEIHDWHRVERDMYDGEVSYHEYTFRFCPNCGAKMEGVEG